MHWHFKSSSFTFNLSGCPLTAVMFTPTARQSPRVSFQNSPETSEKSPTSDVHPLEIHSQPSENLNISSARQSLRPEAQRSHLSFMSIGGSRKPSKRQSYRLVGKLVFTRHTTSITCSLMSYRYEQPWLDDQRMTRSRYNTFIIYGFMVLGLGISAYICYAKAKTVINHDVCSSQISGFSAQTSSQQAFWCTESYFPSGRMFA